LMAEYYAQRAAAGLIINEATAISQQGTGCPNSPGIYPRMRWSKSGGRFPFRSVWMHNAGWRQGFVKERHQIS